MRLTSPNPPISILRLQTLKRTKLNKLRCQSKNWHPNSQKTEPVELTMRYNTWNEVRTNAASIEFFRVCLFHEFGFESWSWNPSHFWRIGRFSVAHKTFFAVGLFFYEDVKVLQQKNVLCIRQKCSMHQKMSFMPNNVLCSSEKHHMCHKMTQIPWLWTQIQTQWMGILEFFLFSFTVSMN